MLEANISSKFEVHFKAVVIIFRDVPGFVAHLWTSKVSNFSPNMKFKGTGF